MENLRTMNCENGFTIDQIRNMDEVENKYLPDNARFRPRSEHYMADKFLLHYFYAQQGQIHVRQKSLLFMKCVKCHIEDAVQRR